MLSKDRFLQEVEERAPSRAEIARVLGLPASRATDLYKGRRDLSYEEAVKLAETFDVEPGGKVSAELLAPVLRICLRHAGKGQWSDQDVSNLAEEIEYGIGLLQSVSPNQPSQDVLDLASRVIADRLKHKPS